jgi:beta-lactamase class A
VKTNKSLLAALSLAATMAVACSSGPNPTASPRVSTGASGTPSATVAGSVVSAIPTTPAGSRLSWVLSEVNGGAASLTAAEVNGVFTTTFLIQVPAAQLIATLQQVATAGPYAVSSYVGTADGEGATGQFDSQIISMNVGIGVTSANPPQISSLTITPATAPSTGTTWDQIDSQLKSRAAETSVYAAEIVGSQCQPAHQLNSNQPLALGSSFKLYVLGELAAQIQAGKHSWTELLAIRDDWRSLLGGTMQSDAAGMQYSLEDFATKMISISDNTAADELIHFLGRESIESNLATMGMANPSLDEPFLTTRDVFALKATKNASLKAQYLAGNTAARRSLLSGAVASTNVTPADFTDWTAPRDIDTLEWFASTSDLCRAMSSLRDASDRSSQGQVLEVLSVNPGMPMDKNTWSYVGFKGGSEPGVLQLSWLLRRSDNRWFVLSMTLDDPNSAVDNTLAGVGLAERALSLLAAVN